MVNPCEKLDRKGQSTFIFLTPKFETSVAQTHWFNRHTVFDLRFITKETMSRFEKCLQKFIRLLLNTNLSLWPIRTSSKIEKKMARVWNVDLFLQQRCLSVYWCLAVFVTSVVSWKKQHVQHVKKYILLSGQHECN